MARTVKTRPSYVAVAAAMVLLVLAAGVVRVQAHKEKPSAADMKMLTPRAPYAH